MQITKFASRAPESQRGFAVQHVATANEKNGQILDLNRILKRPNKRARNGKTGSSYVTLLNESSSPFARMVSQGKLGKMFLLR